MYDDPLEIATFIILVQQLGKYKCVVYHNDYIISIIILEFSGPLKMHVTTKMISHIYKIYSQNRKTLFWGHVGCHLKLAVINIKI